MKKLYLLVSILFVLVFSVAVVAQINVARLDSEVIELKKVNEKLTNDIDRVNDNNDKLLSHGTKMNEAYKQLLKDTIDSDLSIRRDMQDMNKVTQDIINIIGGKQ